ncbi:MAG: Ig-like domain-containing protein [Candidatus Thiothrix putei]|uniref:Ig-like domain-containing protein n=1 Tax=Candidatus Thiothrix putei TaxID=3080811 RepID=A0AA95HDD8_9GAMM|nr:MAG: Ig-like domain-containing protein [Candidatus Thiothrix putei]
MWLSACNVDGDANGWDASTANHVPVAQTASVDVATGSTAQITLLATDADGDTLTFRIVTEPAHGTLRLGQGNVYIYTPNSGYEGDDSFTFVANDGKVDSAAAKVGVRVYTSSGGSSGGGIPVNQAPMVRAEVAPGAKEVLDTVLSASSTTVDSATNGGVVLTGNSTNLQGFVQGDVVFLPSKSSKGLPVPFVGKVATVVTSGGQTVLTLRPANVEDAYSALEWNFDTAKTGAAVVGTIAPKNAKVSFASRPILAGRPSITNGLSVEANQEGATVNGSINFENEFIDKDGKKITLFAEVDLSNVTVSSKGSFNVRNIASSAGWLELAAVIKGDANGKVGLRSPDGMAGSPTWRWSDLFDKEKDIWNGLEWAGDDKFSLEGLEGDDKSGMIPIGGVVIRPCLTGVCPLTFSGNLVNLKYFSMAPTVVLWLYADMHGEIKVSGEAGFRVRGYHFEQGFEFKVVGTNFDGRQIDVATPSTVELYANAKAELTQKLGPSLAADILVGGIRPLAIKTFIGAKLEGSLEGDTIYAIRPNNGWSGFFCYNSKVWAGVQLDVNARVKAEIPIFKKIKIDGIVERSASVEIAKFVDKDLGSDCFVSGSIALNAVFQGDDPVNNDNALINVNFSEAYENANIRLLTDEWVIVAECDDCTPLNFEIPSYRAGIDTISLPVGHDYTLTLQAKNDNGGIIKQASIGLSIDNKLVAPAVTATPSDKQVTLSWGAIQGATGGYAYCYSKVSADCTTYNSATWKKVESGTSVVISELDNGTPYHFRVVAKDSNGVVSPVSDEEDATPAKESINDFTNLDPEVEGSNLNVGIDTKGGTLKLSFKDDGTTNQTFPYIWIANSGEGTISKLDVKTGQELGRYRTGPGNGNPSRTTVDQDGNVWVGNRNNNTITKVGLKEFGQCIDRNGNGDIDTSTGSTDVKPWDGYFGDGQGIANAQDECVLQHVTLSAPGVSTPSDIRMVAIDKDNNVFTGGHYVKSIYKVNGKTGEIIGATNTQGSFYGGFVDKDGNLWATHRSDGYGVIIKVSNDLQSQNIYNVGLNAYGMALNKHGEIWVSDAGSPNFSSFNVTDPAGTLKLHQQVGRGWQPCYAQGVAIDDNDDIFIAGCRDSYDSVVGHYKRVMAESGVTVQHVANYPVGQGPTGVAVDGNGHIWSANEYGNSASKITLATATASYNVETFPVGYRPYNYSDMTGRVVRTITSRQGTWEATFDSKADKYAWKQIRWKLLGNALPAGTSVTVYAKTANNTIDLNAKEYVEVQNGVDAPNLLPGRYLKLKVKLTSDDLTSTPEVIELQLY